MMFNRIIYNDRPMGGRFGVIPDPPEVPDCKERFIEEFCQHCSDYEDCKAEYEKLIEKDEE